MGFCRPETIMTVVYSASTWIFLVCLQSVLTYTSFQEKADIDFLAT